MAYSKKHMNNCSQLTLDQRGAIFKTLDEIQAGTGSLVPTAAPAALTNSTGQVGNDTVAQVANIALSTSNTYTDAAVNAAVNAAIATVNADLADLADKLNALRTALRTSGILT